MAKSSKAKGPPLELALERGVKFFDKGNFPLAKREFETALGLGVSEAQAREIAAKLEICAREVEALEAREAIKRARKLEKKGQHREALAQFEKALASAPEDWIEERILALRRALSQAEASDLLAAVAEDEDPQVRLAAYDKALAAGSSATVVEQRANCLVELERFEEAVAQYASVPLSSDLSRYRQGYACAATGRYLEALAAWRKLERLPEGLAQQVEQLLPFACREAQGLNADGDAQADEQETGARSRAGAYETILAMIDRINADAMSGESGPKFGPKFGAKFGAELRAWGELAACRRLDALWQARRYEDMRPLLPPLGQPLDQAALALHAKVDFKHAERDPDQLESAIGPWLTAVYQDELLDALAVHAVAPTPVDRQALRALLVERLAAVVKTHAKAGRLSSRTQGLWRMEERLIRQLAALPVRGQPPAGYPCTPGFARQHGLAQAIFAFLEAQSSPPSEADIDLQELRACFGPTGAAMMAIATGEEERALAALPRGLDTDLTRYCRERIALACGMAKVRRGEPLSKRHFLDALPLLQAEPKRVQELVDLAYSDKPAAFFEGLADTLEALCDHIDNPKLPEAAAHVMGIKAVSMLNQGASLGPVRKLLERALDIYPESELAETTLDALEERLLGDDIAKAFKRQNPLRAARLVSTSEDPSHREYFFNTLEVWFQDVLGEEESLQISFLAELLECCLIVDENHPLARAIADELEELRKP
jgi:tetratricopeptide (TPR) repeat protein